MGIQAVVSMPSSPRKYFTDSGLSSPWGGLDYFSKALSSTSSELSTPSNNRSNDTHSNASDSPTLNKSGKKIYGDIRQEFKQGKLVAHLLYVDNINIAKTQVDFMEDPGIFEFKQAQGLDDLQELPPTVAGYKLEERFGINKTTPSMFTAKHEETGRRVLVKISSDLLHSDYAARFFNDWYMTLGANPPSPSHLSWMPNPGAVIEALATNTSSASVTCKPITLPLDIPGILYPITQMSVDHSVNGKPKTFLVMVYPNNNYQPFLDFYSGQTKENSATEKVAENVSSGPSERSVSDNGSFLLDRSSSRGTNADQDILELSNQVQQPPKRRSVVANILKDFVHVLRALSTCHKYGIVHNGLTTGEILRSTETQSNGGEISSIVLTGWDFSFSTAVEHSFNSFRNKNYNNLQQGMQFSSPENLCGASSFVDYRTDIYSIGVCMYETIVGCLPFQTSNLAELRRMIVNKAPIRPRTLGPKWITHELDDFIIKCMEKNPCDRFQNIDAMIDTLNAIILDYSKSNDLIRRLHKIHEEVKLPPSPLRLPLFHNSILNSASSRNFEQMQKFLALYHGAEKSKIFLLKGECGVGKATFLDHIGGEALKKQDFVVHWSFDCMDRNVARYAFLIYGVYTMTKQILSSSRGTIEEWRKVFTYEIDADLSVLYQSIPNLKILLGPKYQQYRQNRPVMPIMQPKSSIQPSDTVIAIIKEEINAEDNSSLSSSESAEIPHEEDKLNMELQYNYIFKRIFSVLARQGMTLILDNVNWFPVNEFILLTEILEFCEVNAAKATLTIVASFKESKISNCYENNGTDPSSYHTVAEALKWPLYEFELNPLDHRGFTQYYNLFFDQPNTEHSDFLFKLTKGSLLSFKYYMRTCFLRSKAYTNLLEQSMKSATSELERGGLEGVIKEYVTSALSADALKLLKFASIICSNGSFDICELMIVTGYSLKVVHSLLQMCLNARIIVSFGICYKVPFHIITDANFPFEVNDTVILELSKKARYRFDHSSIHLYFLKQLEINNEFQAFHQLCGLRFQKHLTKSTGTSVISYLNMASHLLNSCDAAKPSDKKLYHEAMINGGRYAISTSNLSLALKFFDASVRFISSKDRRRILKLALSRIQCNYYLGNYKEANAILHQAESDFGQNNWTLLHLRVCLSFSEKKYSEGLKLALKGLESLKIEFALDLTEAKKLAEKHLSQLPLSLAEIQDLKKLEKAWDKRFILIAELVTSLLNATYILHLPHLRLTILAQLVNLMSVYGYTASCGVSLIHLANYFVQFHEDMSMVRAFELADVAMSLVNNDNEVSTQTLQTINEAYLLFMAQFRMPIPKLIKRLTYVPLPSQVQKKNTFIRGWIISTQLFLGNMRGWHTSSLGLGRLVRYTNDLEYKIYSDLMNLWCGKILFEDYMDLNEATSDKLTLDLLFVYYSNALLYASQEEKYSVCSDLITKTYEILKQLPISTLHVLYYFLSAISLIHDEKVLKKPEGMKIANEIRSRFKIWSEHSSANFRCEYKIIDSGLKTFDPKIPSLDLLDLFEDAIEESENSRKWLEAGIASRICAQWLKRNSYSEKRVHFYAKKAYSMFDAIMATKKVEMLKLEYPGLFDDFNWAGVPNLTEDTTPVHQNFFDDCFYTDSSIPTTDSDSRSKNSRMTDISEDLIMSLKAEREFFSRKNIQPPSQGEWTKTLKLCLFIAQSSSIDLIVQKLLESSLMFMGVDYGLVVLKMQTSKPVIKAIGTIKSIYMLDNESLLTRPDLAPPSLIMEALISGETVHSHHQGLMSDDPYYIDNPNFTGFCVPIKTNSVVGAIYLENRGLGKSNSIPVLTIDPAVIDLLSLLCSQAAVSFTKSAVYNQMELAKRAAEDATEEKASFLANMSHEIRTPFNSLFACSIFLLDTDLDNVQREYVETIKNSALVTLNIIDGILAFTKIEHGSFTLENTAFSINDTIESAILFASEQTESEHLEFAYFNNCPLLETIHGDATRIRQIVINLVGNALKFTSVGHVKVTLEATLIKGKRYEFILSVEDTGIGIPSESSSKIFGAFTQVDGSSRRVYGGSGLGLAISKKLAEIMNGKITFTSKESLGSTFVFCCPFEVEFSQDVHAYETQRAIIVSKKTLKKQALKQVLEYYNAKVTTFDSCEYLVDYEGHVDILVIDRECLKEAEYALSLSKWKNVRLHILTRFGLMVSDKDLAKLKPSSILFSPIKRSSVRKILLEQSTPPLELQSSTPRGISSKNAPTEKPALDDLSILIAEDNMLNLVVALQHLKKLGYVADHAKDGVEVLEKCEARLNEGKKYDVIFMDIQMPKKDGIQATIDLKQSLSERGLENFFPKIIALTANVAGEERERCLEVGMVDFVSKPILPDLLKKALMKVKQGMQRLELKESVNI